MGNREATPIHLYESSDDFACFCKNLLSTGARKIAEHTDRDAYWRGGGNGTGKNYLGQLLMELGEQLQTMK